MKVKRRNVPLDNAEYGALNIRYSLSFIMTLISFSYNFFFTNYIFCKISPILSLLYSLLVVLYRRRKLIYYIRQNGFTFPNYWEIHSSMFNYHSLIPWGSFRGRQEEKWGSFRGRDHFGGCTGSSALEVNFRPKISHRPG